MLKSIRNIFFFFFFFVSVFEWASINLSYWVGQKLHLGFSTRCYRNFLGNPVYETFGSKFTLNKSSTSIIITSSVCLHQTDLKSLIAYSSVSHIVLVIIAILTETLWSYMGATALIITHGLTSSILFCLANPNYEWIHSRTIILARGLQTFLPLVATWWLLASLTNLALPPTINKVLQNKVLYIE